MNTINNILVKTMFLLYILTTLSLGQEIYDRQGVVYDQIAQLIESKYGQGYDFGYTMFDVKLYYSKDDKIQDPYETLKGCVLFSACKPDLVDYTYPDNFIIGMVKNGQIIWDNFPGSAVNLSDYDKFGRLLYSQDINNDGEVDLIFADFVLNFMSDADADITYIRILSWNGTRGRFISDVMIGSGSNNLIDVDGDGIMELRDKLFTQHEITMEKFKTSSYPYVTYGWNGTEYGLWPNVRQISENEFLPANRFQATMSCRVEKTNNSFNYL